MGMRSRLAIAISVFSVLAAACGGGAAAPSAAASAPAASAAGSAAAKPQASACTTMRPVSIGIAVTPPNVVHTPPYVAKEAGIFAKHCIDATIVEFEGGLSQTNIAAVAQGKVMAALVETAIMSGIKAQQVWGMAPKLPQVYMVSADVKTAADLKGKKLSAAGGGVGSFNWRMGRAVLESGNLTVNDVQFIDQGTAGRLPGLLTGQISGVALHPEDVYLAQKQKPGLHVLANLGDLLPHYYFNALGVATSVITSDRPLVRDVVASLIEANRYIYQNKDKVIPIMVNATKKPQDAVSYAYDQLVKNCIWSVNTGFDKARTDWSVQFGIDNKDVKPEQKMTYDQIVADALGKEALAEVGGPTTINGCSQ